MHELSIARSIVELVEEQADNRGASVVEEFGVRDRTFVRRRDPTLEFALDSAIKGSKLEKAGLSVIILRGKDSVATVRPFSNERLVFPLSPLCSYLVKILKGKETSG